MFGYWTAECNGTKKACFVYGKDMGHDWSEARIGAAYHSSVVCDLADIKKPPIFYCSSPSVCCEIERAAFFPEAGELRKPGLLKNTMDLDDENAGLSVPCQGGFEPIDLTDISHFVRSDGRYEILKNMLTAVMNAKDGVAKSHLLIADEKENILMWIASLSVIFPLECVKNLSFCTYEYRPIISDFDKEIKRLKGE